MRRILTLLALTVLLTVAPALADTTTKTVTIASSGTVSTSVDLKSYTLALIEMPAAFTGTALTFQCSSRSGGSGSWLALWSNGTQVTLTVAQGRIESTSSIAGSLAPCRYLKVVSGSAEGAERTLTLVLKK